MILVRWWLGLLSLTCRAFSDDVSEHVYDVDVVKVVCELTPVKIQIERPNPNDTIRVPVLYRTSGLPARVTMTLTSASNTVIADGDLDLADLTTGTSSLVVAAQSSTFVPSFFSRLMVWPWPGPQKAVAGESRNAAEPLESFNALPTLDSDSAQSDESGCERFFLLDGRLPVALPDTWQDARIAFAEVCVDSGLSEEDCVHTRDGIFIGYPSTTESFAPSAALYLCERLTAWAALNLHAVTLFPRRLKSSGGGGLFVSRTGARTSNGFNSPRMGAWVGYSPNKLGTRFTSYRTTTFGYAGIAAGSFLVLGATRHGGGSRYGTCTGDNCPIAQGQVVYRDDFMNFASDASEEAYPLTLTIKSITGPAFERSKLCEGYIGMDAATRASWMPPASAGLFFDLSEADDLDWQTETWVLLVSWSSFCSCAVLFCCAFYCLANKPATNYTARGQLLEMSEKPHADEAQGNNGTLRIGAKVKTQLTKAEGGDDGWYSGAITMCYADGDVLIHYDDGDTWTGCGREVHLLVGQDLTKEKLVANQVEGYNGMLCIGARVQTQFAKTEGGDEGWYCGTIMMCYADGDVLIHYDDGDKTTCRGHAVHLFAPGQGPTREMFEANEAQGYNGTLCVGARVQTQFKRTEGGDEGWYSGTIQMCYTNGHVLVHYDDGDTWTGCGREVHLLTPPVVQGQIVQGQILQGQIIEATIVFPLDCPSRPLIRP